MRDFSLNDTDFLAENYVETYIYIIYILWTYYLKAIILRINKL